MIHAQKFYEEFICGKPFMAPLLTKAPQRYLVIGDPQASLENLFAVLSYNNLLTDDGWLKPDVGLITIGDYFDFNHNDSRIAAIHGLAFLTWLAAHDPQQVIILLGNHDVERVMSLQDVPLDTYYEAKQACIEMLEIEDALDRRNFNEGWIAKHPGYPPIVAAHDYRSYDPRQSSLVRSLLLNNRFQLSVTAQNNGKSVLITHAGISHREVQLSGGAQDSITLGNALNSCLSNAIHAVRSDWLMGRLTRLDLSPYYFGWEHLRPNGGCLIHRPDARIGQPTHAQRLGLDDPFAPRSCPPTDFLVHGLHQVVGHTVANQRLVKWLEPFVTASAKTAETGSLLRLALIDGLPRLGIMEETDHGDSSMLFVDVAMSVTPAMNVKLLEVCNVNTRCLMPLMDMINNISSVNRHPEI